MDDRLENDAVGSTVWDTVALLNIETDDGRATVAVDDRLENDAVGSTVWDTVALLNIETDDGDDVTEREAE